MKVGIMLCGALGCTASTLIYGYYQGKSNALAFKRGSMWCSIAGDFPPEMYDLKFSGWDIQGKTLSDVVKSYGILPYQENVNIDVYAPVVGPLDYIHRVGGMEVTHSSLLQAIEKVKNDIIIFKSKNSLDKIIVINFSSPMYCGKQKIPGWDSAIAYSMGATMTGSDWVEFTPSNSITDELNNIAQESGARIAGRDGSTGQTILKLLFRDYLLNRGFIIDGWYSTNIIGNHDGLVLAHPDYNVEKISDKKSVLNNAIKNNENHIVEISYYGPSGDNKESWDCINFTGWHNQPMSMRMNWHGRDSILAAPLALDIIAGLIKCQYANHAFGIVSELGICFKNPIGAKETSYFNLFQVFKNFVLEK